MDFGYSPKVKELRERVDSFMQEHVFPAEPIFHQQVAEGDLHDEGHEHHRQHQDGDVLGPAVQPAAQRGQAIHGPGSLETRARERSRARRASSASALRAR